MRDYKKLIKAGNAAQYEKLHLPKNQQKGNFEEVTVNHCINRISSEFAELVEAYTNATGKTYYDDNKYKEDLNAIRLEAADVANFCHMLILRIDKHISEVDEIEKG